MRSVLTGGVAASNVHPFDAAREAMITTYDLQARVQGVSPSSYSGAASPTAILPPMIEKLATTLIGSAAAGRAVDVNVITLRAAAREIVLGMVFSIAWDQAVR